MTACARARRAPKRASRARASLLAFSLGVLGAGPAIAEPTAAEIAVARERFAEAAALESEERWSEAALKLREALKVKETPGLRYHLGFCLEKQGLLVESLVEYDRAEEMLRQGAKAPDVVELLGPARDGVRKRVARLALSLATPVEGARIELDGRAIQPSQLSGPIPQNPGTHVVTAAAPGRQVFRRELRLEEAESREVTISLPELAPKSPPAAERVEVDRSGSSDLEQRSTGSARTIVLIGEAAFTVVALGAGVAFSIAKSNDEDDIARAQRELDAAGATGSGACLSPAPSATAACSRLPSLVSERDDHARLATLGFVGAGVGAAATVATYLLWRPAGASERALSVAPVVGRNGVSLAAGGRF